MIYKMDLEDGLPTSKFSIYNDKGTPTVESDTKRANTGSYIVSLRSRSSKLQLWIKWRY